MEGRQPGSARVFLEKWFEALRVPVGGGGGASGGGLSRVHDLKLSVVTMGALLEMDAGAIPASVQDGWTGIVGEALGVFQKLPQAIESESKP